MAKQAVETKREYPTTPCEQCGYPIRNETITKAKTRGVDLTRCESCRAKPAKLVGLCKPFQGDLDENPEPVMGRTGIGSTHTNPSGIVTICPEAGKTSENSTECAQRRFT